LSLLELLACINHKIKQLNKKTDNTKNPGHLSIAGIFHYFQTKILSL